MFCALLLPDFRLQAALRHRSALRQSAAAVVDCGEGGASQPRLIGRTPAAARAGVEVGMSPPQGLARCPALRILPRAPAAERALAGILLERACAASAAVEQTAEDLCTLDLGGVPPGVRADLATWGAALLRPFSALDLAVRAGIAENPDLALLAARATTPGAPVRVVADSRAFLAALPLEAAEPSPAALAILRGWGVSTLGGVARLDRTELAARLGPGSEGARLRDRARGRATRLLRLVREPERFEEAFDFERELDTAQPLLFLLRRFVDQLARRLEALGLVAAGMRLVLPLAGGGAQEQEREFRIPAPTANPDVLFRVLETYFENLRLETAPTGVRLVLEAAKPEPQQFRLFENALRDPNRFAETVARLLALVGGGNAGTPECAPTHKPDQFALHPPGFAMPPSAPAATAPALPEAVGLPLRRFRPPLPARVHLERARPRYVVSEQAHGEVADCLGPYRLSGGWWEEEARWSVEEWDVRMADGSLYRLARRAGEKGGGEESWSVEGCYDR